MRRKDGGVVEGREKRVISSNTRMMSSPDTYEQLWPGVTHGLILRENSHDLLMVRFDVSSVTRTCSLQQTQEGLL